MLAGVHQHEAAGAVGVFGHARFKASLAEQGALLVPGHAADGNGVAQQVGATLAKVGAGGIHLRQQCTRDAQQRQQRVVPLVGAHIEKKSARSVADIGGMHCAAC